MKRKIVKPVVIECTKCGHKNVFGQPHPYHAGFGNQGFLYNEKGNRTLIWSSFDPDYERIVGHCHPWMLTTEQQERLEQTLLPDDGGRWLFVNPARCESCQATISEPMIKNIYYLEYNGSINLDPTDNKERGLKDIMKK